MKKVVSANISFFEKFAQEFTKAAGSTAAFFIAFGFVILWIITGPIFNFSNSWQLIINTATTIITFLMVFLIQKTQNKESLAIQLKLNELVAASQFASNRLVDVENMSEEELIVIHKYYTKLADLAKDEVNLRKSHSIDDAKGNTELKKKMESELKKTKSAILKKKGK